MNKIAFVLTPVDFGGSEQVCLTFLQRYKKEDTLVTPILLCRPWEKDNIFINALTKHNIDFLQIATRKRPREQGKEYFRIFRSASALYTMVKQGQFNLLHTNGYFADIIGLIVAKLCNIPIITTCHGFISNTQKFRLYNRLDLFAIRFMDGVIAVSKLMRNEMVQKGIAKEKTHIVQNAVESIRDQQWLEKTRNSARESFNIDRKQFLIGYVGRLSEEKGLRFLIEGAAQLHSSGNSVTILVIGDGPLLNDMKMLVSELNLEENIRFAGFQSNVKELLPAFDVFVLPSLTEGTSMALLEAMACALPIVATNVGGTPQVIQDGSNGVLVPPSSPHSIAAAVERYVNDEKLRFLHGTKAQETVEADFGVEPWLKQIDSIYRQVLLQDGDSSGKTKN